MGRIHTIGAVIVLGASVLTGVDATAQVRVTSSVVSAGATVATNGSTSVLGTLGQGIIGRTAESTVRTSQGFWYTTSPKAAISGVRETQALLDAGSEVALRAAPNPCSEFCDITVELPRAGRVVLTLHDALGRRVMTVVDGARAAGRLLLRVPADGLPSGHYTARLIANGAVRSIPLTVVR